MEVTEITIKGQKIIVTGPTAVYLKDRGRVIKTPQGSTVAEIKYYDKRKQTGGGYKLYNRMRHVFDICASL